MVLLAMDEREVRRVRTERGLSQRSLAYRAGPMLHSRT
jgi:hypothetical protein